MNKIKLPEFSFPVELSFLKMLGKEALGVIVSAVLAFFFYEFAYMRNVQQIKSLDAEMNSVRTDIEKINSDIKGSERLAVEVEKASLNLNSLESRLKGLKERLPSDKSIAGLYSEISEGDIKKGVRIISIKPLPPEDKGELIRLPFQVTLEAGFIQFGGYLERIENMPRLMMVDNFIIEQKDDRSGVLTAQVFLSAYILNRR